MKKTIRGPLALALALLLLLMTAVPAFAAAPAIRDIDTHVLLREDGSALVTQVWDVTVVSGTEYYIPQENLGQMEISGFAVTDETGLVYENVGEWDLDLSLEEKAGKCGVNYTSRGLELCWGVGSYGDHVFTIQYEITGLVQGFTDYAGFNHRFVNDQLSSPPRHAMVTIEKEGYAFIPEETGVWAFGFVGDVNVLDGKIVAETIEAMRGSGYMNIMCRFAPELFAPENNHDYSFSVLEEEAKRGSDYTEENDQNGGVVEEPGYGGGLGVGGSVVGVIAILMFVGSMLFPIAIIVVVAVLVTKSRHARMTAGGTSGTYTGSHSSSRESWSNLPRQKEIPYSRQIPCEGYIPGAYFALRKSGRLGDETTILGAYLLRWAKLGSVRLEESTRSRFLGFGEVTEASVVLQDPSRLPTPGEQKLFDIIRQAAGSDGVLQEKEFQRWCSRNYGKLEIWMHGEMREGERYYQSIGGVEEIPTKIFFGLLNSTKTVLTPRGREKTLEVLGFKNYLTDFTLINERKPVEVELWDDYLVFASLYGIADQVAKDFKDLYPKYFETTVYAQGGVDPLFTMMMIGSIARAGRSGIQEGRDRAAMASQGGSRSSGGGGSSSFGGGGGFSGGGSGGGSR